MKNQEFKDGDIVVDTYNKEVFYYDHERDQYITDRLRKPSTAEAALLRQSGKKSIKTI